MLEMPTRGQVNQSALVATGSEQITVHSPAGASSPATAMVMVVRLIRFSSRAAMILYMVRSPGSAFDLAARIAGGRRWPYEVAHRRRGLFRVREKNNDPT